MEDLTNDDLDSSLVDESDNESDNESEMATKKSESD